MVPVGPRLQVRVTPDVEMAFTTMAHRGASTSECLSMLGRAWLAYDAAAGGHADAKAFLAYMEGLGRHTDPATVGVDVAALRQEVQAETEAAVLRSTLRAAEEAVEVGITAVMVSLLEPDGTTVGPELVAEMVAKWFRANTNTLRRILGGSRRLQDWLCGATGRVIGESSQGAWYVRELLEGRSPGTEMA